MSKSPHVSASDVVDNKDLVVRNNRTPSSPSSNIKAKVMSRFCISTDDDPIILLNIGGVHMSTRRSTLICIPNTVLALACTSPWSENITHDQDGRLFFDFDPTIFTYLLNQLRDWSVSASGSRKVFDLPRNECDRQRFRLLCAQLNFNPDLLDGVHRHEKFGKTCGHIMLNENGLVAIHGGSYQHGECRGINVYSSGIHRIVLVIGHRELEKYNTFIGIIWSGTETDEKSFQSSTAYGWAGQRQVYLKGVLSPVQGYGGYDCDICNNDTIELILNCQLHSISMINHRTRKYYEIPIDIREGCPFPWQLHINIYAPNDQVKIINPI